jgi:flagellum-specific peptidoglycan hydrolase FlgJ
VHTPLLPEVLTNKSSNTQQLDISDLGPGVRTPNSVQSQPQTPPGTSPLIKSCRLTPPQLQFLLRVTPPAVASERDYEIPACITIAQAILESATPAGWGSSSLFRLANNPFGIKYCHWQGAEGLEPGAVEKKPNPISGTDAAVPGPQPPEPVTQAPADYGHFDAATWEIENGQRKEILAQFQRFPNLEEAFRAHALLLRSPHYQPAFEVRLDWKQFAERLGPKSSPLDSERCGYSTNPTYSAVLIQLVEEFRLNDPRMLTWLATGKDPGRREEAGAPRESAQQVAVS